MSDNAKTTNDALMITGDTTLEQVKKSADTAYSMTTRAVPITITVKQRFERNANNGMVPVPTDEVSFKIIVTEYRCFGGNPNDLVVHGCATDDTTLPGDYKLNRGEFVDMILCLAEGIGEISAIVSLDGNIKYNLDTTGTSLKFADTERLVLPYACR